MLNEENGRGEGGGNADEYGQPAASPKDQSKLTFEQQKAELKRKILAQPPKRQKIKKEKKDTVFNPESKLLPFADHAESLCSSQQRVTG